MKFMTEICPICNKMMDRNDFRLDLSTMTECFKCGVSNHRIFWPDNEETEFVWFLDGKRISHDTDELIRAHKLRGFL